MKKYIVVFFMSLFLFSSMIPNQVSAQTSFQTFENNPIEYWNYNNSILTYHDNNTITFESSQEMIEEWLVGFSNRKSINISGSVGTGTNYQVEVTVTYDDNMQSDFDDIRFTDNDKKTELSYWRETYTISTSSVFWVKVTDSLETSIIIYMYYGNNTVSTTSNGDNVFLFFDDFENNNLNRWTTTESQWSVTSAQKKYGSYSAHGDSASTNRNLHKEFTSSIEYGIMIHAWVRYQAIDAIEYSIVGYESDATLIYICYSPLNEFSTYSGTQKDYFVNGQTSSTWIRHEIGLDYVGNEYIPFFDRVEKTHQPLKNSANDTITEIKKIGSVLSTTVNKDQWLDDFYIRKFIVNEPSINGFSSEENYTTYSNTFYDGEILIPILNKDSIDIRTMVQLNTITNTECVTFSIVNNVDIDSKLYYNLEVVDIRRIDFSIKKAINIYKISVFTDLQTFVEKIQYSQIDSKTIKYFRISLSNFTSTSKLTMFFLSGNIDYSTYSEWQYQENAVTFEEYRDNSIRFNAFEDYNFHDGEETSINIGYSYIKYFHNFQYIRTYINLERSYDYTSLESTYYTYLKLNVSNVYLWLRIQDVHGGESSGTYALIRIYEDNILKFEIEGNGEGYIERETQNYGNNFKIWRTLENKLGFGFGSDTNLFRHDNDTRETLEEFTYYYTQNKVSNYSGKIEIEHDNSIYTDTTDYDLNSVSFAEVEYDFTSDFEIAEPHFSSTWFSLLPFGGLFNTIVDTSNNFFRGIGIDFSFGYDFFTGIADATGTALSPVIESIASTLSPVIEAIASTLSPILESIVTAISDSLGFIGDSILTWVSDSVDWFINTALMGIVDALAAFFIWFVDGIGALMGITGLAGILADIIVNFGTSILNFVNGIVLFFSIIVGAFGYALTVITYWLPIILYYGFWIFAIITFLVIATMDFDKIKDLFGLYAKILEKIFYIFYHIANMVIQFIGGIIP